MWLFWYRALFSSKFRITLLMVVASFLMVFNSSDSRVHSSLRPARIALLFHTKQWNSYYKIRVDGHASAWIERLEAVDESNPRTAACSWSCSFSGKVQLKCESTFLGIFSSITPKPKSPTRGLTYMAKLLPFLRSMYNDIHMQNGDGGRGRWIFPSPDSSLPLELFECDWCCLSALVRYLSDSTDAQYTWRSLQVFVWLPLKLISFGYSQFSFLVVWNFS